MNIALSRIDSRVLITMDEQEKRSKDEKRQQEIELPMEHTRTSSEHGAIVLRTSPSSCRTFRTPIRSRIYFVYGIRAPRSPDQLLFGYSFSSSSETTSYPGFVDEQLETQSNRAFAVFPPASTPAANHRILVLPLGSLRCLLALLRLLRLVIEKGCS